MTRAFNLLQDIFKYRDEISLGVSKDTLIVDQNYLDKGNTVYRDFARAMSEKSIASVSFRDNLTIDDLNGFLTVSSFNSDKIKEEDGLQNALLGAGVTGIKVTEIDFNSFELTEEDEISSDKAATSGDTTVGLWDSFVYNLMGDTLGTSDSTKDNSAMNEMIRVDSKKLAKMMNEMGQKKAVVTDSQYDRLISDYLKEASSDELSENERKKLIKEVAEFTNELSPDLRKQLLSSTFRDGSEKLKGMDDFISDLSNETILETLENVSTKQQKIPMTIMSLLEKFSQVGKDKKKFGVASEHMEQGDIFNLKGEVEELLFDDHQQDYTPDSYQAALTGFVKKGNVKKFSMQYPEMFDLFKKSFSDEFVDLRHALALMEITKIEKNPDSMKMLLSRLNESGVFFTETGQYESAALVWSFFFMMSKSNDFSNEDKEIVLEIIKSAKDLKIADELIEGLRQWGKEKFDNIKEILVMFQDMALKPLLKALSFEESAYYRKLYMNILAEMDRGIASELVKYLGHKKWYFVRNMVVLLRQLKAVEHMEQIRACFAHENKIVRVEVLKTLLELKGNVGLSILKSCIDDEDESFSHACILLAGSYQITDLGPILLEKLNKGSFLVSNFAEKKVLIQALGGMAAKDAIPYFEKLLKKSSIIRKSKDKELKLVILNSLRKYDRKDIDNIINIGLNINDDDIQAICRKIQ